MTYLLLAQLAHRLVGGWVGEGVREGRRVRKLVTTTTSINPSINQSKIQRTNELTITLTHTSRSRSAAVAQLFYGRPTAQTDVTRVPSTNERHRSFPPVSRSVGRPSYSSMALQSVLTLSLLLRSLIVAVLVWVWVWVVPFCCVGTRCACTYVRMHCRACTLTSQQW